MSIEFRFPGGRWEPCPIQDTPTALVMLANYDLRIDGALRAAVAADPADTTR